MLVWGTQFARPVRARRNLPFADSLIPATALRHNLILVTRTEANFKVTGIRIIHPWH